MIVIVPMPMSEGSQKAFAAIIAAPFVFAYYWYKAACREEDAVRMRQIKEEKLVQARFRRTEGI